VASLVIALIAYISSPAQKPPVKTVESLPPVPKLKKELKRRSDIPKLTILPDGKVIIPQGIPRNMFTIKIMADETPDLVIGVVKNWLKQGKKSSVLPGAPMDPKVLAEYLKKMKH